MSEHRPAPPPPPPAQRHDYGHSSQPAERPGWSDRISGAQLGLYLMGALFAIGAAWNDHEGEIKNAHQAIARVELQAKERSDKLELDMIERIAEQEKVAAQLRADHGADLRSVEQTTMDALGTLSERITTYETRSRDDASQLKQMVSDSQRELARLSAHYERDNK